ncbi:MAG: hypothetical protein IT319_11525 [Anaerolineae bacterium]|nr:hypothetical protein [Anaerolineae bacterium]
MNSRQNAAPPSLLSRIRRYLQALALAARYTLRGDKPPLLQVRKQYPALAAWWDKTVHLVEAVERKASASRIDPAQLILHIDRRDISMATILQTVKYHAGREFPYLMAHDDPYGAITLQATNFNDRYLVQQLAQQVDAPLRESVEALERHLGNMPNNSSS